MNRRSGSRFVLLSQSSLIGGELERRYVGVASQTRAVPSRDAPTTRRELGSKCAAFAGPSSTVTGMPTVASAITTAPSELADSTCFDVRSNSTDRIGL